MLFLLFLSFLYAHTQTSQTLRQTYHRTTHASICVTYNRMLRLPDCPKKLIEPIITGYSVQFGMLVQPKVGPLNGTEI